MTGELYPYQFLARTGLSVPIECITDHHPIPIPQYIYLNRYAYVRSCMYDPRSSVRVRLYLISSNTGMQVSVAHISRSIKHLHLKYPVNNYLVDQSIIQPWPRLTSKSRIRSTRATHECSFPISRQG